MVAAAASRHISADTTDTSRVQAISCQAGGESRDGGGFSDDI